MKNIISNRAFAVFLIVTTLIAIMLPLPPNAGAATRNKANNTNNLNLTTSWSGGVVPGSGDIALWDSTVTGANTVSLGADLNFGEIQITNPGGDVTIGGGNTLTLSGVSGVGIDMTSATHRLSLNCANVTLGAAQSWNLGSGHVLFLFGSTLNNGGNLLSITGAGANATAVISNVISGSGGLDLGAGSNVSLMSTANTYSGVTTLGGYVSVTSLANINTSSSIGKGSVGGSAADLVFNGGSLSYSGSGASNTNRLFTMVGGPGIYATIASNSSTPANSLSFTNTGAIAFSGSGPRVLYLTGSNTGNNTFAPILGDGPGGSTTLQTDGANWIITGANTYTGETRVWGGTLTVNGSGAIGASAATLNVSAFFSGGTTVLNLNVDQTVGALSGSVSGTGTATINIASTKTLTSNQSTNTTYAGVIAGAGAFTKSGTGTLTLSGTNTYSGITKIDGGILSVGSLGDINTASSIGTGSVAGSAADLVFGGGTLQYSGTAGATSNNRLFTIGDSAGLTAALDSSSATAANTMSFTGTGSIAFGGSGARTLTLTGSNTSNNAFAPIIGDGTGGATSLIKSGAGTWVLSGNNTYSGGTTLNSGGTLNINSATAIGTGVLALGGNATIDNTTANAITLTNSNALTLNSGSLTFTGTKDFSFGVNTTTIGGTIGTRTITTTAGTLTVGAIVNGATIPATFAKAGAGTLAVTGNSTYTAATTIAGTLKVDNNGTTTSGKLAGTTGITINGTNSGTLLLSGSSSVTDRINNTATMTLNGGTFNTGGLQEHGATNNTAGVGALTLQSSSIIDMATGTSILAFANSSANSAVWGVGKSLDIWNWTGTPITGGGTDQLYFGNDATGLTASQLVEIHFYTGAGTGLYGGPTLILADGEVLPLPEPNTWIAGALSFGLLLFTQWRRYGIKRKPTTSPIPQPLAS